MPLTTSSEVIIKQQLMELLHKVATLLYVAGSLSTALCSKTSFVKQHINWDGSGYQSPVRSDSGIAKPA